MKKEKQRPKEIFLQRSKCDCMAMKHELINNCLNCGKVVCAKEGQGNCLYCGHLVTRPQGTFIDDTTAFFPSLTPQEQKEVAQQRSKAILHKNKLVERDKSTKQQNIFDQQLDYYQISENKWLDEADRQHAIDRILATGNQNESEKYKVNVKLDPLTGEFVREEHVFDQEAFKKEGQTYLEGRERQEQQAKDKRAKERNNWDQRVLRSEKMRDLFTDIVGQRQDKPIEKVQNSKSTGVTEVIVDE